MYNFCNQISTIGLIIITTSYLIEVSYNISYMYMIDENYNIYFCDLCKSMFENCRIAVEHILMAIYTYFYKNQ